MLISRGTRLEVWGDPIAHSRSPQLHAAAYGVLGLDWTYGRRQVAAAGFASALTGLGEQWRGLSLTMPLKPLAFAASMTTDAAAEATGAVNTLLLTEDGPHGFNTDVGGIVDVLRDGGVHAISRARILGAGATATSALVALADLGAREVGVLARRPEAVLPLTELGRTLGVSVRQEQFALTRYDAVDATICTLPADADTLAGTADALAADGGVLLDVVYGHGATLIGAAWERVAGPSVPGVGMLLHQAVRQIRVFVGSDPDQALADEEAVVAAMRRTVMGD